MVAATRSQRVTALPKLEDIGVTKSQSSRYQQIADVPKKSSQRGTKKEPRGTTPTLAEMGIDKKLSAHSQKIAKIEDDDFEAIITDMTKIFVPEKLILARGRANLKQSELGKLVNISGRQISRYETGEQSPRLTVVAVRLADTLGIDPESLYKEE